MKILVTGSEGNIGSKLVPHLRKNHEVYRADLIQDYAPDYSVFDIKSAVGVYDLMGTIKPDVVINLAAMVSRVTCEASPALTIDTNVNGAYNVARACRLFGARMVNFSTSEVYGNLYGDLTEDRSDLEPNNIYGFSKMTGEMIIDYEVRNNGLKATTIRPFMIYDEDETIGEHRSAMIRFANSLIKRDMIYVHKGASRSWLHISDAVRIIEGLMCRDGKFNIGNHDVIPMAVMARMMCDHLGLSYNLYVREIEQPKMMTLYKRPYLVRQDMYSGTVPEIDIQKGISLVLEKVKDRLNG